jgi:hypothetical protein
VLGYISIAFWIFAQFPQLIKNASSGTSESLSLLFLANWLSGDFANLIGCVFTSQLPFQTYLAIYFVLIDTSLFVQSLYFQKILIIEEEVVVEDNEETHLLANTTTSLGMVSAALIFIFSYTSSAPVWEQFTTVSMTIVQDPTETNSYLLGRFFA